MSKKIKYPFKKIELFTRCLLKQLYYFQLCYFLTIIIKEILWSKKQKKLPQLIASMFLQSQALNFKTTYLHTFYQGNHSYQVSELWLLDVACAQRMSTHPVLQVCEWRVTFPCLTVLGVLWCTTVPSVVSRTWTVVGCRRERAPLISVSRRLR